LPPDTLTSKSNSGLRQDVPNRSKSACGDPGESAGGDLGLIHRCLRAFSSEEKSSVLGEFFGKVFKRKLKKCPRVALVNQVSSRGGDGRVV